MGNGRKQSVKEITGSSLSRNRAIHRVAKALEDIRDLLKMQIEEEERIDLQSYREWRDIRTKTERER